MSESAIHIEGIDEATHQHVRIHLRLVTSEESFSRVVPLGSVQDHQPEVSVGEVARRRAAEISSCQAQVFGSARGISRPDVARGFIAPRGFMPAR